MISIFKKGTPKIVGGLGDGTRANPWYWYGKTSGQTVAVNNSNASSGDNYRVYLRVYLKGGTTYTIGQTSIGGDGDGMIWLYNSAMSEVASDDHSGGEINGLEVQDVFDYTPSADGVYIIGAGAYDSDKGDFTVAMSPAPEQETLPEIEYQYPTSSGFNALGRPLKYRSAAEAGCGISYFMTDGLLCHFDMNDNGTKAVDKVNGIELTAYGNIAPQSPSLWGTCWKASASGAYLAGNNNAFTLPQNFTINAYINYSGNGLEAWRTVVDFGGQKGADGFGIWLNYGKPTYRIGSSYDVLGNSITTNTWHMLTLTYNGTTATMYIDGVLSSSKSVSKTVTNSTTINMFKRRDYSDCFFGSLDEVCLWNYAMNESEVQSLLDYYNKTKTA